MLTKHSCQQNEGQISSSPLKGKHVDLQDRQETGRRERGRRRRLVNRADEIQSTLMGREKRSLPCLSLSCLLSATE